MKRKQIKNTTGKKGKNGVNSVVKSNEGKTHFMPAVSRIDKCLIDISH